VQNLYRQTGSPVIVVGHSLGGLTVTGVVDACPELVHSVVYLCAYMLPPNELIGAVSQHPSMEGSLIGALIKGDAQSLGAARIDPFDKDPAYRHLLRRGFLGENVDDAMLDQELNHFHCDEPLAVLGLPSPMTRDRFGRVPRHYIRTSKDALVMPPAQDHMIAAVDAAMGNATIVHTLSAGHSPHVTQCAALAILLSSLVDRC
jgi:pimeloyl-ACP methyl ester carboxylesterase